LGGLGLHPVLTKRVHQGTDYSYGGGEKAVRKHSMRI